MKTDFQKSKKKLAWLSFFIVILLLLIFWLSNLPDDASKTPTQAPLTPSTEHVSLGEQGIIAASTTVGVTKEAYDMSFKALSAKDAVGFYQLQESGQTYDLTIKTKVLVIGTSSGYDEVRFLDGPNIGKTAWVEYEIIQPNR
jgi:hypothetical protein